QTNKTFPNYVQLGDTICLNCYNGIITRSAIEFQQHALEQSHHNEPEIYIETSSKDNNNNLTFSQAVGIVTDILYEREHQGLPPIWIFEEFRAVMELEDKRLKYFFDELYLSINPLKKSKSTMENVSKQLVFLCYFICGIRNKFVNNAKRDLGMYLDSTGTPDSTIDTLATLGMTITSRSIAYHKDAISKKHLTTVESNLADSTNSALVLNIDDYHSIHIKRMPDTTTTSSAEHLATILLNPIKNQPAIPREDIHNPALIEAQLIKIGIENNFMSTYSLSHNQRWGFHLVSDKTKLEELTVHSYDVRLKEKRNTRSLKDAVLVDLLESKLQSMEAYINAINVAASVPTINRYIEDGNVIPVVADWPGQIFLRTAISQCLIYEIMNAELPKFSDSPVEIFHSLLRRSTEKHLTADQIIKTARNINYLRFDDDDFKENFVHTSSWAVYQYSSRNIETLTRKTACYLLDCFTDIYTRINHKKIQFLIPPQVSMKRPLKRSKKEGSANTGNSIPIPAMKMKEAWLCHLPLGYSSSHKPSLYGCDSSNCFITKTIITEETGQDGVDKHVQSLLESLHQINSNSSAEGEDPGSILEDDNDDIKESADDIL
ncbi:5952_t:CDS:2, partial [Entrophospora sp. SA101]